jgi:hypothetical protein
MESDMLQQLLKDCDVDGLVDQHQLEGAHLFYAFVGHFAWCREVVTNLE